MTVADEARFSPEETLIIFDWDDTVMPSSWIIDEGLRVDQELAEAHKEQLSELSRPWGSKHLG